MFFPLLSVLRKTSETLPPIFTYSRQQCLHRILPPSPVLTFSTQQCARIEHSMGDKKRPTTRKITGCCREEATRRTAGDRTLISGDRQIRSISVYLHFCVAQADRQILFGQIRSMNNNWPTGQLPVRFERARHQRFSVVAVSDMLLV